MKSLHHVFLASCVAGAVLVANGRAEAQPPQLNLEGGSSALCPTVDQVSLERPHASAGPTDVGVAVVLNDLIRLDDIAQSFSVDLFLIMQWVDPRVADPARGSSLSICTLDDRQTWIPQVQFQGVRRFDSFYEDITGIDADGLVTHAQRLSLDIAVPLNLRDFPFDRHALSIEVQPTVLGVDEVQFRVVDALTGIDDRVSLTGWTLGSHTASIDVRPAPRIGVDQTLFRFDVEVARESNFYIFKTVAPLALIIFMSWAVFWIDPTQIGPQLALPATSMLTLIAYQFAFLGLLPRISYLTRADRFILGSSFLVFLALVEAITATALVRSGRAEDANRLDRACRFVFPALLSAVVILAFVA